MRLKTKCPSKKWRDHANKEGWTLKHPHSNPAIEILKQRLLKIGGWSVCFPHIESDLVRILERGRRFAGRAKMMKGEPCQCHFNSASLWENNRDISFICTGYALSKDGMWRQHSWCAIKTTNSYKVIETTESRISYYGYILDSEESEVFLAENF